MGCQSEVFIGDNLTFSICTHDPDTGALTDADFAPGYYIYEDETATAILDGTMAKLDDANTTGFYTQQIACTTALGFEAGKSYTIYIQATVDSDMGGISYGFTIRTKYVEGTITLEQALQVLLAYVAGEATGGGTTTITFRDTEDSKDRIVMTVDANGNRSAITLDLD